MAITRNAQFYLLVSFYNNYYYYYYYLFDVQIRVELFIHFCISYRFEGGG